MSDLFAAVVADDLPTVRSLLASGANVHFVNAAKETCLHVAKSAECVELLIAAGANVRAVRKGGATPLMCAASAPIAELLLRAGALLTAVGDHGRSVLHAAVERHDAALCRVLLDAEPALVNRPMTNGSTPILLARTESVVRLLIERDARVDVRDSKGQTPLNLSNTDGAAILLLQAGAKPTISDFFASYTPARLRAVLQHGGDPNWRDRRGNTMLHRDYGIRVDMLHVLAEFGHDFCSGSAGGRAGNVLFFNQAKRDPEFLKVLIECEPKLVNDTEILAVMHNNDRVFRLFFACGMDVQGKVIKRNYTYMDKLHAAMLYASGAVSIAHTHTLEEFLASTEFDGAALIADAKRDIERERIDLIRARAATIAIALQDLDLPAWVTLQIVEKACEPFSACVRLGAKWAIVTAVKHFVHKS